MAALILPTRRVVQPQQPVQVDWSNPLTRGLLDGLVDFGAGKVSITGKPVTRTNTTVVDQITGFRGRKHTGITDRDSVALEQVSRSAATLFIHGTATATAANTWYIAGGVADSTGGAALMYEADTSFSYFSIWSSAGTRTNVTGGPGATFPVGVKRSLAMAYGGSNLKAYLDGVKVADGAAPASTKAFGTLNSGTVSAAGQYYSWYGIAPIILLFDRALSEVEIRALSDNPWQIFEPIQARIWVPATAPAGSTGSLASTESNADAAALTAAAAAAGALAAAESGADTLAASIVRPALSGSIGATESGADALTATGGPSALSGAISAAESAADSATLSAAALAAGALSATEGADAFSATSGSTSLSGALTAQEAGADTATATGTAPAQGSLAVTETGADTLAATSGSPAISGTLSASESGADTASASASATAAASLGAVESSADTAGMTGLALVLGWFAAAESGADTAAIASSAGALEAQAQLTATETGQDAAAASAAAWVTAWLAAAEASTDSFSTAQAFRLVSARMTVGRVVDRVTVRRTVERVTIGW